MALGGLLQGRGSGRSAPGGAGTGGAGAGCRASGWGSVRDWGPLGLPVPLDLSRRRGLRRWQLRAGDCGSFINPELTPQFLSPEKRERKSLVSSSRERGRVVVFAFLTFSFLICKQHVNHCLLMITEDSNFN